MGNKSNNNNNNDKKNKDSNKTKEKNNISFTLCPLIDERKLIIEKRVVSNTISCIGILNYDKKEYIILGFDYGKFEIIDSENLESVAEEINEINMNEYIRYVGQLLNNNFIIVSGDYARIYVFYKDSDNSFNIKLIQKFRDNYFDSRFSKGIIFDKNLYKEYDLFEMEEERRKKIRKLNSSNYKEDDIDIFEELIICSDSGIFVYKRNQELEEENQNENKNNNDNNSDDDEFDINSYLEKWETNPYVYYKQITDSDNYDMVQANFKYLAGTIKDYLCIYSLEIYELVTKFRVKISKNCDSVIFMIKEDILCVAGEDTISLTSIKDFEIILVTLIKRRYRITEICILPDYNILIGMQRKQRALGDHIEYFYQYKCYHKLNPIKKMMEYDILEVSSKLLTKNYSNITMRCLNNSRIVTVIDLELIQVWE